MHTVEKIGGTSMSRFRELMDTILIGDRSEEELYNRIFVVSAYGGITNLLLEHKKTGEPGVYARFANAENETAWREALATVKARMLEINRELFGDTDARVQADASSASGSRMWKRSCPTWRSCAPTATSSWMTIC